MHISILKIKFGSSIRGKTVAAGAIFINSGYACMAFAGTLPEARGKGDRVPYYRKGSILQMRGLISGYL